MGILLLAGLLGMLFQLLAKANSIQKDFQVANQPFVPLMFLKREAIAMASSVVFILILAMVLPEILDYKPELKNYVRVLFIFGGALGSWAFGYLLGKSKKFIRNKIDEKTDIADAVTGTPKNDQP